LLGESVARADLDPRSSGLAGGLDLSGLQFVCRFSQAPGGFEPADRPVGGVESAERSKDPLGRTLGSHRHSVFDTRYRSMIRWRFSVNISLTFRSGSGVMGVAKKGKKSKKDKKKGKKGKK
jgi:hypothetical protein